MERYDVIVVGAGPAGLVGAHALAQKGLKTLVLDRKQEIGPPKRCAEGLTVEWLRRTGIEAHPEWAIQPIWGARLYAPNGKTLTMQMKEVAGYVLERKMFEKHLAIRAAGAGARIRAKTDVEAMERKGNGVVVHANQEGAQKTYEAPLVIACDGVDSRVARWLGLKTHSNLNDMDSGYQYELTNIKGYDEKLLHLYFGNDLAPRGYAWIFPKRTNTANVGIGIGGVQQKTAKHYLDQFVESHPEMFSDASVIEVNGGGIPVGGFLSEMAADNLMACGDAGRQVDPIHGGGIGLAMEAALLAAQMAAQAHREKRFDAEFLNQYTKKWYAQRGNELLKKVKIRDLLGSLTDADFNVLVESVSEKDVLKMAEGDLSKKDKAVIVGAKLVRHPRLAKVFAKYLTA